MTSPYSLRSRSARELRANAQELVRRIGEFEGPTSEDSYKIRGRTAGLFEIISDAVDSLSSRLSTDADLHLSALVFDAIDLLDDWDHHRTSALSSLDDLIADSLVELSGCKDEAELFERLCPEIARAFGSQSVLIARLEKGVWSAWRGHQITPGSGHLRWTDAKAIPLIQLPVETEVIHGGHAVALAARQLDSMHLPKDFRRISESGPYIMAPIFVGADALALLYTPQPSGSTISLTEFVERLQRFVATVGRILERELLYSRFRAQRKTIRASLGAMERIMSSLDTGVDLVRLAGRAHADTVSISGHPLTKVTSTWDGTLTTRERDVMGLLVLGNNNAEIAVQLAIAPATVKSHVRSIMKKLGAVNRTELITRYQGVSEARVGPRKPR